MNVVTYEGVVENGQVRLPAEAKLPENAKVYVVVSEVVIELDRPPVACIRSPRLADPAQAAQFEMEVLDENSDEATRPSSQISNPQSLNP
jgi:hypothetical protein